MSYTADEGFVSGFTDIKVFYRRYIAKDAKRTIIVVHGLGEHSGRYMNLVNYFKDKQTNFYLIDNRGHGQSQGQRGHIILFGQYLDDLRIFVEKVREEESEREHDIYLLGHSMGGNIVANYLIQRDSYFTGAILSGPGFKIAAPMNPLKTIAGKVLSNAIPFLSLSNGLTTSHLSRDLDVVKEYEKDSLVHDRVTTRWFTQYLWAGNFAIRNAKFIKCPVLILQGGDDKIVASSGSQAFYNNLTIKEKEIHIFDNFYHEIFNEIEKEKPLSAIEEWIKKRDKFSKEIISYRLSEKE